MAIEICLRIPDGPDVVRHIGEISHHAMVIGADLRMQKVPDKPVALLQNPPPPVNGDDDVEVGVLVDPEPTPTGRNRRR